MTKLDDTSLSTWMHLCMCECVFAYEKPLLALQLSVQRAVHLYFTTHLTNTPNLRQMSKDKYLYVVPLLHVTVGVSCPHLLLPLCVL